MTSSDASTRAQTWNIKDIKVLRALFVTPNKKLIT